MTTTGWFIFAVVMPAVVAGLGWLAGLAILRQARRDRQAPPAE